jgi:preprotein translocase subunit SecY
MWLGEQITERGIGNGISLLIFSGIVIGLPRGIEQVVQKLRGGDTMAVLGVLGLVIALVAVIAFIVFVEAARRKIPVSYAKRHVGRQLVGGQQTTMPLKINMGGVIPVIFASSVLSMPQSLFAAFPPDPSNPNTAWAKIYGFFQLFHASDPYYELIFLTLIVFFTFLYVSIVFNVEEVAISASTVGLCQAFAPDAQRLNISTRFLPG